MNVDEMWIAQIGADYQGRTDERLLDVARLAAAVNVVLLVALGSVWLRNYRSHGASHTLGLLVFAVFLLVENLLWLYFYVLHPDFIDWFTNAGTASRPERRRCVASS